MARCARRDSRNRGNSEESRPLTDPLRTADLCLTPLGIATTRRCHEWALRSQFQPTEPRHFAGIGRYYPGWSDRPAGVQWSLWHDLHEHRVVLAVNLEGMADAEEWPIGRVIARELDEPQLSTIAAQS